MKHGRIPLRHIVLLLAAGSGALSAQTGTVPCDPQTQDCQYSSQAPGVGQAQNMPQSGNPAGSQSQQQIPGSDSTALPERINDQGTQLYVDSAGNLAQRQSAQLSRGTQPFPPDPIVDMQRLTHAATGQWVPVFGRDLFQNAPTSFAPADQIPSLTDYVVGPGDELLLRLWGATTFNGQLTVDSSGSIYIPKVGAVHVAGLRVDQLQGQIGNELRHSYRNFNLSVNLGHLRSIQVYVVGEARRPGAYTVSSLSTLLNVLFLSGGPSVQGSLRHIQVRRNGAIAADFDLYDLLLRGDKSKDIRLEANDTVFIPSVGPQAALAGSVHHPAIYELASETSLGALLELAGGFTPTAATGTLSLERVVDNRARAATTVNLDASGRATSLRDGDVLFASHITAAYQESVTIRGNLANPGRFPFHAGMRLSEIIPDRMSLLTTNYWQQRNRLGVPVPLFEPLPVPTARPNPLQQGLNRTDSGQTQQQTLAQQPNDSSLLGLQTTGQQGSSDPALVAQQSNALSPYSRPLSNSNDPSDGRQQLPPDSNLSSASLADRQPVTVSQTLASPGQRITIKIPAPEIDWSYAVIERLDPVTLKNTLVPFNLNRLLDDHDPAQDLPLQPNDIVTILSQADIRVPQDEQTKFVRLEGEFKGSGVYSVGPGETLDDLVRRAGGLTEKAYLYGASFTRESAQIFQQQRLDEYINTVAINMQRDAAVRAASSPNAIVDPNALVEQQQIVAQLRKLRATGRIVLEFRPDSIGAQTIPHIPLENGDIFRVPSRPLTVNVIGAVYGQNVFLYNPQRRVEDYLLLAGKPNRVADRRHAFIIRADGSVFSRERAKGLWKNSFESAQINPGDSIVVPEQPIRASLGRQIIDLSQIFSQLAVGSAAISVISR